MVDKDEKLMGLLIIAGSGLLLSQEHINPLSASPTKWSNTLKQFVGNLPTNCLCV